MAYEYYLEFEIIYRECKYVKLNINKFSQWVQVKSHKSSMVKSSHKSMGHQVTSLWDFESQVEFTPSTNFAAHAKPAMSLHDFFFEVLHTFWHQVCENWTFHYGVTWPFLTKGQLKNLDFFFYFARTKQMAKWFFLGGGACKAVIFPLLDFIHHSFKLNTDPNENLKQWKS